MLGLLTGRVIAGEVQGVPLEDEDVSVEYRNGLYRASLSVRVAVPLSVALEVLTDFEHMADFMPNLSQSHLLARQGNVFRIRQLGKARFGPFSFPFESERQVELTADGWLMARALGGSTRRMHSELHPVAVPGGTRLDYSIDVEPEQWLPSSLGISFMRHELAEQFTALGREMMRRQQAKK